MTKLFFKLSIALVAGGVLLGAAMAVFAAVPMAGTNTKEQKAKGQSCPAPVNTLNFGYYETRWREWPCQARPDKTFPGAIGREVLSTPEGEPTKPLPRAEKRPSEPLLPPTTPGGILPPGGINLPGGPLPPGFELPAEPSTPGMPGLPPLDRPGTSPLDRPILPPSDRTPLPGGERPAPPSGPPTIPSGPPTAPSGPLSPGLPMDPQGRIAPPATLERTPAPATLLDVPTSPSAQVRPATTAPNTMPVPATPVEAAANQPSSLLADRLAAASRQEDLPVPMRATAVSAEQPMVAAEPAVGSLMRLQRAVDATRSAEPALPADHRGNWVEAAAEPAPLNDQAYAPPAYTPPTGMPPAYEPPAVVPTTPNPLPAVELEPMPEPIRPVEHKATVEMQFRGALNPVYEQPAQEPAAVQRASQPAAELALEGFCPVSLVKNEQWVQGTAQWQVNHAGRTYYFANEVQRECFLVDPDRYVAAANGCDIVALAETGQAAPGVLDYCVTYDGRLYMFASAGNLAKFRQNAARYLSSGK